MPTLQWADLLPRVCLVRITLCCASVVFDKLIYYLQRILHLIVQVSYRVAPFGHLGGFRTSDLLFPRVRFGRYVYTLECAIGTPAMFHSAMRLLMRLRLDLGWGSRAPPPV